MEFIKDVFYNTEPYEFYLVSPENNILCSLNSIDSSSSSLTAILNDRWELSFNVEKYIDVNNDGNFILSNGYGLLEKGMEIFVEGIGYFVITEPPSIQNDGYSELKNIKAESCEIELENKDLISFYVNTGKTGSKEYTAEGNVITDEISGQKLLKRYVALYDPDNPELSLLDLALENLPGWSIGHVDESYIDEEGNTKWLIPYVRTTDTGEKEYFFVRGQFEEESINVYAFLTQKVSQAYRCVFTFDILNRKVNCYHISQLGKDTGIYLSSTNYLDSLSVNGATNDIYTQFNVAGGEGLNISYVNFGENAIENLSYVLKEPLVSTELMEKYEYYLSYRGSHWDKTKNEKIEVTKDDDTKTELTRREYYSYLYKLWAKHKKDADEIKNRVPNDGLMTDWDTFNKEELTKQLDIYIDAVNFILLQYGYAKRDENGDPIKKEDGTYETVLTGDALKAQMYKDNCWYTYTAYVDGVIPNIKIALENLELPEGQEKEPIDAWETQWELFGVDELKVKIQSYQNSIDTLKENGYDQPYEVSENATDYYKEYQDYIEKQNEAKAALEVRQSEYDTQNEKMEEYSGLRTKLADECNLHKNKDFGFIDDNGDYNNLGKTILKLRTTTDYVNENYLITSLDDIETYVEQAEALYTAATEELSTQCRPQYIYQPQIENLLCDENFSGYLDQLILGDFLWMEIDDGDEFGGHGDMEKFRLYSISFNPKDISERFEIEFTNFLKSQSKRTDEVYLLNSTTKTSRNQITSPTYTGVDESINAILTPELLKALSGKLASTPSFGNAVGNVVEYINSQPNSVVNITASQTNVNKIVGSEAQFEQFFSKYIDADYINARVVIGDVGEFKDLTAELAKIKQAIIGTSSTETGIVFNLSAQNAKIDEAWVAQMVVGKLSVADLAAGDITLSDQMRILSENGNLVINGNTMQFLNPDGEVGIQIGYGTSENPSIIIKDENGTALWTSQGVTKDAIADGLIVNDMLENGTVGKEKLGFSIVEPNEYGGIDIGQIYLGDGGKFGVEYTEFKNNVEETQKDLDEKIDASLVYNIEIHSTNGNFFKNGEIATTLSCHVYKSNVEITDEINAAKFHWYKINNDGTLDKEWNDIHAGGTKEIQITKDDVYGRATFECHVDGIPIQTTN